MKKGYLVRLTWNQICALVDIAEDYVGEDSTRWHVNTLRALERRGLIHRLPSPEKVKALRSRGGQLVAKLSAKGDAFLSAAQWTYEEYAAEFEALAVGGD